MTEGFDTGDADPRPLVGTAFDGAIDVVGDVHGEIDALEDLLRVLGYTGRGEHAHGRRLVFIGDLCDRGPDSPGVIRRVREMVAEGTAQCLLGNHELNVLRGVRKEANGWFFTDDHDRQRGLYLDARPMRDDAERSEVLEFCRHAAARAGAHGPAAGACMLGRRSHRVVARGAAQVARAGALSCLREGGG